MKRSLHLTIDILLNQYGLFRNFGKSNFPTKLQLLDDIGILPITIMKNLNVERNLIEHDYDTPPLNRVAEAIDVVKLLLLATEKLLESTPYEVVVGWKNPKRHILIQLEPIAGELRLFNIQAKGQYRKIHGISCIWGGLRGFSGRLNPSIKIPKTPWKVITLNRAEINEWRPIITELVNIKRKSNVQSVMDGARAEVTIPITMPITIPLPSLAKESLAKIMDDVLGKKFEEEKTSETSTNEAKATAGETPETDSLPKGAA